jgi:hypothetical protein
MFFGGGYVKTAQQRERQKKEKHANLQMRD